MKAPYLIAIAMAGLIAAASSVSAASRPGADVDVETTKITTGGPDTNIGILLPALTKARTQWPHN